MNQYAAKLTKKIAIAYMLMATFSLLLFACTYALLYCYAFIAFGLGFVLTVIGMTVIDAHR